MRLRDVPDIWNEKWEGFILSKAKGDHRLKMIVCFAEEGIEFLTKMNFLTAYCYESIGDTGDIIVSDNRINLSFEVDDIEYTFGYFDNSSEIEPEVSFDQTKLAELCEEFQLNEVIPELATKNKMIESNTYKYKSKS